MKFEQKLSQKQTQKLAMTQQLQQSIQILQYNTEELQRFLEEKMLENPLIDLQIGEIGKETIPSFSQTYRTNDLNPLNQIPDTHRSLFESLIGQIHLNYRATYLRTLVLFLVEYIDVNGYLLLTIDEAVKQTGATSIEIVDALTLLQQLDPAGVGARDLKECLMLQVERDDQAPALTYAILEEEFEAFANRQWEQIAKKFSVPVSELQEIFDYLQLLTPNPGSVFESTAGLYIKPDLIVEKKEHHLQVFATNDLIPKITFQTIYYQNMQATNDQEVQTYIGEKKREYEWLQKTLLFRGKTILAVGSEIVKRQASFFLQAEHPLQPMTLKEIAQTLSIHESTVSRSVNGKYFVTDFGVFELKSFFTSGLTNERTGEHVSSVLIKNKMNQCIINEDKKKPLSDQKIVERLKKENIDISRRTVAKYREELGIPASSKRKRFDN